MTTDDPLLVRLREILQRQLAPLGKIGKFPALEAELRALLAEVAIEYICRETSNDPVPRMREARARFGVPEKP